MRRLAPFAPVIAGAIGLWFGVEAIRSFFTIIVWNVAEDLPSTQLGMVGGAFWIVGLLGWIPARLLRGTSVSAPLAFGALVAVLTVLRQAVQDEGLSAILAIATLIAWLWWLPAWLHEAGRGDRAREIVPALLLGMAAQVAGQIALDGLDLHALPGLPSAAFCLAVGAALVWALRATEGLPATPFGAAGRWGAVAVLPWLFLQLTLLGNLGRLELLGDWSVPLAGLVSLLGLLVAALTVAWSTSQAERGRIDTLANAVAAGALLALGSSGGLATFLLLPAQSRLAILLHRALALPTRRVLNPEDRTPTVSTLQARTWLASGIGGVLFFAFLFTLYSTALDNLGAQVWPAAALIVALPELLRRRTAPYLVLGSRSGRVPVAVVALAVVGIAVGALPARPEQPSTTATGPAQLTVLNYNIHQGFSRTGYPNLERTAAFLRAQDADIITLQEVPRIWDLSGAVDTFAWLQQRLPEYRGVYGATSKARFGNAIFSRTAPSASGVEWFAFGPSRDQRGFAWAEIPTSAGPVLVITMHMTPYNRGEEVQERDGQAQQLLDFWAARGKPRAILAGDYNSERDDPAYQRLLAAGLIDASAVAMPGLPVTFRSTGTPFLAGGTETLDYVLTSPATGVVSGSIPETDISDHYPLLVTLDFTPAN